MRILEFSQKNSDNSILLKVLVGEPEFRHLKGYTDQICMFATQTIDQESKITKTGARHSFAKWFLLPAKLRAFFGAEEYDYNEVKAGFMPFKDCVYIIYRLNKKGISEATQLPKAKNEAPNRLG